MTIDPRWSIALAIAIALISYVAGAGALLTQAGADPGTVTKWVAICSLLTGALSTINAVLTGIPSKDNSTGFIIKGPPK